MFWKFNLITTSHIETLLGKENITLKELMDEEDILQDCKAQTKKLIEFLIKPEVMEEMVNMIVQEPAEEMEERLRYKYSNIACELLTSDVGQISDALVLDEALLNKLYGFLDTEKPLNPLLASFCSKTLGLLISRRTEAIFEFLKSKEDFVSLVLNHIETSAIMDLLLRLVTCIEQHDLRCAVVKWLSEQRVVERLVALVDPSASEEQHGNAAQALCDIIKVSREQMSLLQEKADRDPLLESIESTQTIAELLNHMFGGEKKESVVVNGVAVLLCLLEFKKQSFAGSQPPPNAPPPAQMLQADRAPQCFASLFFCNDGPDQMTPLDAQRLERGVGQVLAAVAPRLGDFHRLFAEPPQKAPVTTTVGVLDPPLGSTRLEVAHLMTALVNTNTHTVNMCLAKLETISALLDLFFKYTWNNFLHTQVEQCIANILANSPTEDEEGNKVHPLLDQLFSQCKIIQRVLDAWEENEQEQSQQGKHRRGYMGHLTKIANHIAQNTESGNNADLIKQKLSELGEEAAKRWETFVAEKLAEANKKNQTPLVGGIPLPSNSEDEECVDFRDIPFPQETALQQAFADYQMQQMTSNFVDQFGFNDDEFVDTDENITGQLDRLSRVSFQLSTDENMKSAELFEQACRDRIQSLDDGDSDEDVWEDKEHEITFSSEATIQRQSSANSEDSSDSEEEVRSKPPAVTSTPVSASEEVKMEVDQNDLSVSSPQAWAVSFDTVPMEVAPVAMDTSNPWETGAPPAAGPAEQGGWADFSNFSTFDPPDFRSSTEPAQAPVAMETAEASSISSLKYAIGSKHGSSDQSGGAPVPVADATTRPGEMTSSRSEIKSEAGLLDKERVFAPPPSISDPLDRLLENKHGNEDRGRPSDADANAKTAEPSRAETGAVGQAPRKNDGQQTEGDGSREAGAAAAPEGPIQNGPV